MKKFVLIFLASLVVLSSGCTDNSPINSAQQDVSANYEYVLSVPEDSSITETRESIRNRMDLYNITYAQISDIEDGENSSVLVYTPERSDEEIQESLRPASFYTSVNVYVSEDSEIMLGENYSVEFDSENLRLNGVELDLGETETVNNVELTYEGPVNNGDYANISAKVYDSSDVLSLGELRIRSGGGNTFTYSFRTKINEEAGERMRDLARNFEVDDSGRMMTNSIGETAYLNVFFRGSKINELAISPVFQERIITSPSTQGMADTGSKAKKEAEKIMYSLRAGELPEGISIQNVNEVNKTETNQ